MWRDTYEHMDMIWARLCLYDLYSFLLAQFSQDFSDIPFQCPIYLFSSILWGKDYVILTPVFAVGCAFYLVIFFFHY